MKKNLKLLLVSLFLLPVAFLATQAEVTLQKSVIGAGGSVGQTIQTDNGPITLSGTLAQTAVETKNISGGAGPGVTLYEGFWTPDEDKPTGVEDNAVSSNTLSNYPNPFNSSTKIQFSLAQNSYITIRVYDINGSLVSTVVDNQPYTKGDNLSVDWDAKNELGTPLSSGSYLYELSIEPISGGRSYSLRNVMVIVK